MDKELVDQLDDVIASLRDAEAKAKRAMQTMRRRRVFLGLEHHYLDEEITRVIGKVRHTKLLAERRASSASADEQESAPERPEVDGRVVALSDSGDTLVVQPVPEATALPSVVPEEAAGVMDVGAESAANAAPESVIIPPAIAQPPAVDDEAGASPVTPDAADGPSRVVPPDAGGT
jgi:hypothetical protein